MPNDPATVVIRLLYFVCIGVPLCFAAMFAGLMMLAIGLLLCLSVVFLPVGIAYIAAGMTTIAVGVRLLTPP